MPSARIGPKSGYGFWMTPAPIALLNSSKGFDSSATTSDIGPLPVPDTGVRLTVPPSTTVLARGVGRWGRQTRNALWRVSAGRAGGHDHARNRRAGLALAGVVRQTQPRSPVQPG